MKKIILFFVLSVIVLTLSATNNNNKKSIYAKGKSLEVFQAAKQVSDTIYMVKLAKHDKDFQVIEINDKKLSKEQSKKFTQQVKKHLNK